MDKIKYCDVLCLTCTVISPDTTMWCDLLRFYDPPILVTDWDLRHCTETHYHKAYIVTDEDVHPLSVEFFEPNLTQVVSWFDVEIKHRLVSLSLGHMLDHFYVEEIIFESLIAHFATTATVSCCQIASRLLKPACDRNLRRLPTSIIEKLLTACELLGRWRGCCISSSVIIRQCGWPGASTTFFESQRSMWSYSSSSSSSTSAITLIKSIIWDVDWSYVLAFLPLLATEEDAHKEIFSICLPCAWSFASWYSKCCFHSYTYCETLRKGTGHSRYTDHNRFLLKVNWWARM